MRASINEDQLKYRIILTPNHEPIRFKMALPTSHIVSFQLMWIVGSRKRARALKKIHGSGKYRNIQAPL